MPRPINRPLLAFFLAVVLHALALTLALNHGFRLPRMSEPTEPAEEQVFVVDFLPSAPATPEPEVEVAESPPLVPPAPHVHPEPAPSGTELTTPIAAEPERAPASMAAPSAPTAEEWAFAASYPLKNSKGYRYSWGQQVRSQMGTAIEGVQQGAVRFRVEIAPDGSLSRLDTLWATSDFVEQLARRAVEAMPPLPPTPTGRPLVFEKTINFSPFIPEMPPVYKDDCLPDPPRFRNRFAWDGQGQPSEDRAPPVVEHDPLPLEDCLKLLPQDSIEAEAAHDQRQLDRWGSSRLGPR